MKTEIFENDYGLDINIIPETPEEVAKLLRFSNNVKSEKPSVSFYFNSDKPTCTIWLKKISMKKQNNAIGN